MIKKKYLKSMVALVLAGTLTMQSAAVYAMDFDDGSAGVQMEEDASVLEFQDDTDQVMDIAVDEGQPDDTAGVDFSSGAEIEEVPAVGEVSGDFNYEELNGSFVKITEYIGSDQEITIPKEINGFTVQQIGDNAFENSEIISVTIPDTVTSIGKAAFKNSKSLANVKLGSKVKEIGESAFCGCVSLVEISVPASVENIGIQAFQDCTSLETATLVKGLKKIDSYAFSGCTALPTVEIPDSVTAIGYRVFYNCTGITTMSYPVGWTECAGYSSYPTYYGHIFEGCTGLTGITVPEGITELPKHAFEGCSELKEIILPSTLEKISESAFKGCTGIGTITVPDNVKKVELSAFEGCSVLKEIILPEATVEIGAFAFSGCKGFTEITLPSTLGKIGYRAFYNCEGLEKINYPSSWTECTGYSSYPTLYGHIFEGCTNLAAIEVPEGVKKIPEHAFEGCSSVKTITLPESLEEIGGYAFDGCSSVKELEVPANVAKIGEYGLANNPGLTKVTFKGEKLEEIGAYAFTEDNGLKRVELPDSIKTMGYHVFYKCISLTNVNYPVNWTECSGYSSYPTRYGAVFEGCTKLIRITIPEGVRTIPRSAFEMWTGVERIALPDSVQTVEDYAFGGCSGLKRIYIGNNVSSIGDNSFKDHTADLTVYGEQGSYAETYAAAHNITFVEGDYRGGLSVISGTIEDEEGNGIEGVNVFVYDYTQNKTAGTYKTDTDGHWTCDDGNQGNAYRISYYHPSYRFTPGWSEVANAADKVTVDKVTGTLRGADSTEIGPEDVTYSVLNGSYISIDSYTGNAERIRIPEEINGYTVQKISNNAFKNNKNIQSVSLPESVETIGESAFENCGKLTEVVFPSGLESISIKAFQGCTGLTEVMLPNGLKKIDSYAFSGCTALPTVEIPDSVTAIGYRVFYNCTGITTMSYPVGWTECAGYSSYPTYYGHIFEGCTGLTGITVPEGITELPKHAFEGCSELKEIILPSTLEKISESAFKGCTGIGTITVPDNVKKVELSAFEGCSVLKEIILPEATVEIGAFAFSGCKGFTEITLPSTLGKIGYRAFYNCEGLEKINYPSSWTECTGYSSYPTLYGHIFEGCTNLAAIEVPEGVKKIPEHAFEGCSSVKTITLPESLEEIGGYAFDGCSSVKELEVPANVVKIGECGLARMIDLSDLTFKGEKLEEIGAYAFTEDSSLKNIELPDSIKAMGYRAFYKCAALESVNYPVNWTECSGYSSYPTRYGAVFEGCTKLIRITIPEGITVIADYAFEKADKLRYVTFPSTLKMIGKEAFKDCAGLPYIDFPYELKTIGESAFEGCGGLINLEIPGSVSTVGKRAFYNNENLNTVQIQEGVQILSDEAFANNKELSEVYLPDSLTQLGKNVFANCPDVVIYCHNNTVASRYAISNELNIVFMEDDQQKTHEVLDDDDSWYTFSVDNAMSKGYIDGSVKYTVRENLFNEISDMSLKVKFPSNIKLDLTSVTLDGVETGYETVNNSLIVPVTKQSGVLKFTLTPETSKSYYTFAELDFTRNQTEQYEIIDTVSAKIPELTLKTNEITSTQNVVVSGVAPAGQTVNLSVDGQKIATTYARRSGNYSATITIPEAHSGEYYVIGAQATDKNNNSVETETGVSYLAERPSVTKFDMYYNNHQEAKLDLMQESLNGSAVSFNPAYPFMFVVGFDNVENVKKVQIKSTKKNEIVYMDTVYDEISKNYVASGFFDNRSGYVPGTLSITYQTKDNINYDIENQNDVDLLLRNVKKMYANTSEALTVKSQSHDVQTGMDTIVIEVGDTYQKYFGDNKELNLIGQIVKAEKDEATIKEIIDGYKIYDHYFDYTSDNYYLTVIDNWVQDPTSKNARSGLLILIGNSLDNTITKLAVVSDQGIDASDYFKGMSVVGKVAKSYGKILGNMNFAGEIRTKINSSDMTSSMKQKMLKDVNNYEVACNIYQGLTGLVGIGVTLWAGPTVKVAYYVVDYVAQDYFTQWKKAIQEGNCGFGFADYMETVCIRIFSLGMEVYPTLCPFQAALFKWIIDPSGCVYVGSLSNPLKGAMVTLYYLNEETGKWEIWDASEYSQKNPITTGSDGVFAWDVPEGQWKVKVECKGYETMWSDVYTVPPEQTDINLNMQADQDVAIDSTYMTEGYVEITFTQLVLVDTLNTIQLTDEKGNNISYTVQNQNEVTDPDGKILVSSCRLVYDDSISPEQVNVQIMDGLTSYNGTKVKSQTVSVSNKGLPAVTLEDSKLELRSGDCILAKGKVENYSGQAKVEADTDAYSVAKIYRITQPDEDGQFEIYLDGINIGQTTLNITLTGTEISSQIAVTVGSTVDESKLVDKKHDHEYDDGVVVKEPTCGENGIKRYTCTTCQETKDETIPATGRHSYGEGVIRTNATCVKDGLKQYTCQACGMIRDETIPATGKHNFGKYSITKAATVLAKGTKTRTCKVCGEKENISIPKLTPILKVNASSVVLKIRQSTNGLKVTYGDGDRIISWNSSNTKIVKVSAQGKLTAQKKTGTAKVTVRLKSGLSKQISVRVQKDAVRTTKITGLPEKLTLKKGQKRTLNPVLMPFTSVEKVTYQSSDKKIVSVTSKGVIKGVKKGKSRITVKAGKKKYVVTVTVK